MDREGLQVEYRLLVDVVTLVLEGMDIEDNLALIGNGQAAAHE